MSGSKILRCPQKRRRFAELALESVADRVTRFNFDEAAPWTWELRDVAFDLREGAMAKIFLLVLVLISFETAAHADDVKTIPARLDCKAIATGSKPGAFTDKISFVYSKGILKASRGGRDTFRGTIDPLGKIDLDGKWKFDNDSSEWEYSFSGQLVRDGATMLRGGLKLIGSPVGERRCTILFELPGSELLKRFSPQTN
jgi:hypothetical protein